MGDMVIIDPASLDHWTVYVLYIENQRLVEQWEVKPGVVITWLLTEETEASSLVARLETGCARTV